RLVNKRVFESLVKAGAFDSLAKDTPLADLQTAALRPRLMAAIDPACEAGARVQADRDLRPGGLFGDLAPHAAGAEGAGGSARPPARPGTESEQLAFEKKTLGLYWSGHPVDRYASALKKFGAKTVGDRADAHPAVQAEQWGPGGRKPLEPDTSI